MSVSRVPVVTELKADDAYDVIFVVMRYTQLDSVMDTLRSNKTKAIVFVGNNMSARSLAASLPEKNVLFAFALSAGHRESDHVASIDLKKDNHRPACGRTVKRAAYKADFRRHEV